MHEQANNELDYSSYGVRPPERISHGVTPDDIRAQMKRLVCSNWRLYGNELVCDTDYGPLSQTIDPAYILTGMDEDGLPILTKVVL